MKVFYDGQTYDLKTRVDIWTSMDVVLVEYGKFAHKFHLTMWFFQFIASICRALILNRMIWTKNYFKVSHRKQVNSPSNIKLVTLLKNFECQPCGIFQGLSYHQEDGCIDPIIFAATVGSVNRIHKLFSSNFMEIASSVSVIF